MVLNAASSTSEAAMQHLRKSGLRLLAWPLLNIGGLVYYLLSSPGEFRLRIAPTFLLFAFLSYRLMRGDGRWVSFALVTCWLMVVLSAAFVALGLLIPQLNVRASAFIVLFELSRQNVIPVVLLSLVLFAWPIIPLTRARAALLHGPN
jgi:hypothetical protein